MESQDSPLTKPSVIQTTFEKHMKYILNHKKASDAVKCMALKSAAHVAGRMNNDN